MLQPATTPIESISEQSLRPRAIDWPTTKGAVILPVDHLAIQIESEVSLNSTTVDHISITSVQYNQEQT